MPRQDEIEQMIVTLYLSRNLVWGVMDKYKPFAVYKIGDVVEHRGCLWMFTASASGTGRATSTIHPGEHNEGFECWMPLGASWRKSAVPVVRRKAWRKKKTEELIRVAEANMAAYRHLRYDIPLSDGSYGCSMPKAHSNYWSPERERSLRNDLELTCKDVKDILSKRRKRAVRRVSAQAR